MSAQQLKFSTLGSIRKSIDKSLLCIGKGIVNRDRFGFKVKDNSMDKFLLTYYKKLLQRTDCEILLTDCVKEEINKLTLKYN